MFTTFVGTSPRYPPRQDLEPRRTTSSLPSRPKRAQVARACDYCRVHRIKCDTNQPCLNCQSRGSQCTTKGTSEIRTLPTALREIERLRNRVRELEDQLEKQGYSASQTTSGRHISSPVSASPVASPDTEWDSLRDHGQRVLWGGIHTSTAKSSQTQWYGPSSAFFFIGRLTSHLQNAFQQPLADRQIIPNSASRSFASPTDDAKEGSGESGAIDPRCFDLTGLQEDYFLGLFWQSYHCTYQIIDEAEFRTHYRSLWTPSRSTRKPSALVDIILALCMQLGVSNRTRSEASLRCKTDVDSNDGSIAGRWLYRRSQMLLSGELESPTISTLQCHIFSVVYLCNASFQNMAHTTLALAIRTGQILGLHLEPPEDLPRAQKELRKRIWWTLYAVEVKTCMKLGRPWSANLAQMTTSFPSDDPELAMESSSNFAHIGGNVTWLTYCVRMVKLILEARSIYLAFCIESEKVLKHAVQNIYYERPDLMEATAEFLLSKLTGLDEWLRDLPDALKTRRRGDIEPYSTKQAIVDVEVFAPLWLQRQRLLLELLYHNLSMNLRRPFICFYPKDCSAPTTDKVAHDCVAHAMTITNIMQQVLTETDILTGWHEAFQWQWNAALSMIGFTLAYPHTPRSNMTPTVRRTIDVAIKNFEILGNNYAIAASAAKVTRDLTAKADLLCERFRQSQPGIHALVPFSGSVSDMQASEGATSENNMESSSYAFSSSNEEPSAMLQDALAGYLDLAFNDSFNSFDGFVDSNGFLTDAWNFGHD